MRSESALEILATHHARLEMPARIGVLVPWANVMVETELPRLGLDRIAFHYSRLVPARRYRCPEGFLRELAAGIPAALGDLARLPLAGTLLACTSVGFTFPGTTTPAVVGAFEAILSALARLQAHRVVLATPYSIEWTVREVEAFGAQGLTVLGHTCIGLGLFDDYSAVSPDQIHALIYRLESEALAVADALVLSCTAWPTLNVIDNLEQMLGIPVVSSNLALGLQAVEIASMRESA